MGARGDDLDDDYAPDELVALSDDDYFDGATEFAPLEDEEDQFVADDSDDDTAYTRPSSTLPILKPGIQLPSTEASESKSQKKRKKRAKDNERKAKVRWIKFSSVALHRSLS